jgi:crotonobetainyl-CoA:carnitine CoA-transferase CaiB-like acyl-CoA transferase
MTHVLEGLRVVDVTSGPVGGIATMVLADFGADVVKVESPAGDGFRTLPSSPMWLRGKRSVALDLHAAERRDALARLVTTADVVVVSGPPGRAAGWGVDADAALTLRPDLVHCSITGWGPVGPFAHLPGYEAAVAAASGRMMAFERQLRRGGPVFTAVPVGAHVTAQGAVQGIVAALLARARGGGGQRVETSLLQGMLPFDLAELLLVEMAARGAGDMPNLSTAGGDLPTLNYHPVRTADGRWIQCGNLLEHLLMSFLDAIDLLGELLADDRFVMAPADWDAGAVEVARDMILTRMQTKTAAEWMAIFRANGNVAAEVYGSTVEGLDHPDVVGNGDVVTVHDPVVGAVRTLGPLAELTVTPGDATRPAPTIGEHTDEVLASLPPTLAPPRTTSRRASGAPLDGITIVEFATIIAAPLSTALLADLGARVVRVEVTDGDPYRHLIAGGTPAAKTTAGKESVCADLKTAAGREIARELVRRADVLVHNYRPGVPERLGLGYDDLRALNPRLVWVSIAGYGRHGPGANRPATHPCAGAAMGGAGYQAAGALAAPCTTLDDVREVARQLMRANESNPDPNTSVVAASATLLALLARERHGVGQAVYVNMLLANGYANADDALTYAGKAPRPLPDDGLHGLCATYRLYRARTGWVFVAVGSAAQWHRACVVLERADLASWPAVDDASLTAELSSVLATRDAAEWERAFAAAGVAVVRADASTPGVFFARHPQMLANGFAPVTSHTRFGEHRRWGPIVTVNGGLDAYRPGVLAGEHTDAVLAELGYDAERIAELRATGVVASEPVEIGATA